MYNRYYQEFCNEVHKILSCYLFWKILNNRTAKDEKLLSALNETPLSWIVMKHSINVTLFITLGRVFDKDNDSFSVDDLLKCCIKEIDSFSKESLRNRKMEGENGVEPEWLIDYIEKSYTPSVEDFQKLKSEVAKYRKIFEKVYLPIRHKLIAHNDKKYMDKADELWAETNIDELEKIIWFLNDLKETLFDSYHNGKKPLLIKRDPSLDFYERDFGKLLDSIKNT
ncbi:MAG: hypothetical protein WC665_00385 [Sulfurimonas sp.]|jgi:hypothetical protein